VRAIQDFIDMGGYGAYVWPSYVVSAVVLVAVLALSIRALRANTAEMSRLEKSAGGQDQERGGDPGETQA